MDSGIDEGGYRARHRHRDATSRAGTPRRGPTRRPAVGASRIVAALRHGTDGRFVSHFEEGGRRFAFETADAPVTVGLVIDSSGSMRNVHRPCPRGILEFVASSNRDDEALALVFRTSMREFESPDHSLQM